LGPAYFALGDKKGLPTHNGNGAKGKNERKRMIISIIEFPDLYVSRKSKKPRG